MGHNWDRFKTYFTCSHSQILTGLPKIDDLLTGLRGLVGLVGEPETCKSTLALQIGITNAKHGIPVFYIDVENGESLTTERALCNLSKKCVRSLYKLSLTNIEKLYQELANLPFFYRDETLPFNDLVAILAELSKLSKSGDMLLIVDSLQGLWAKADSARLVIDEWLCRLDELKLKYDGKLVVLLTCEKNRASYGRVVNNAAKESGRIEYKLSQQLDLREDSGDIMVTCTKNRYGRKGGDIRLYKVFENSLDAQSFTFTLKDGLHV